MFKNKCSGAIAAMDLKSVRYKIFYWMIFTIIMLIALTCLLPMLWVLLSSFKSAREMLMIPPKLLPDKIDLHKITQVWNMLNFAQCYLNSIEVAAGTVVFTVISNGLAGFVLSRIKPKGSCLFFTLMIWTMLLPNTLSLVPLFKTMISFPIFGFNLSNTFLPMWLCSGASAFYVIIFKSFFDSIPMSLIEAAKLDGCGSLGIFNKIILPMSRPIISVMVIFSVNSAWGDFLLPYLILRSTNKYTVMVKMFLMKSTQGFSSDIEMMTLIFVIIPPLIIFLIFQKYIMQGFNMSGIKG